MKATLLLFGVMLGLTVAGAYMLTETESARCAAMRLPSGKYEGIRWTSANGSIGHIYPTCAAAKASFD